MFVPDSLRQLVIRRFEVPLVGLDNSGTGTELLRHPVHVIGQVLHFTGTGNDSPAGEVAARNAAR